MALVSRRSSPYGWRASGGSADHSMPASDDVEDETRNMEAAFGSHLVPRRTLRVTNPEDGDADYEGGDRIESLMESSHSSGTPTTPSP